MKFKAYHKIRQYKDAVRDIKYKASIRGLDENGKPILEESKKPVIEFVGTVKLHGTNAGICYTPEKGVVGQKRSGFLVLGAKADKHYGFNGFLDTHKEDLEKSMQHLWDKYCKGKEQVTLYGEWAGAGVQKGVAISKTEKSFFYFDCKVYNPETQESRWIDVKEISMDIPNVYNIKDFQTWSLNIDFNNPAFFQNDLIDITNKVEQECPISKTFGHSGIGEGVVWTAFWKGEKYIFKVKGEKHSTSKVKTLASINPEILKSINDFLEYACTPNRIEQGIKEVNATEKKDVGNLLSWVAKDILSEESDSLKSNGLEWKKVAKYVNNEVRRYYFNKITRYE